MRIKETVRRGRCEPQLKERAGADAVAWTTSHGRKKMADVYDDCSEITPNMDLGWGTLSVDPSSQDFLIQSDSFFARGPRMLCVNFTVLELETCAHVHHWLQ